MKFNTLEQNFAQLISAWHLVDFLNKKRIAFDFNRYLFKFK